MYNPIDGPRGATQRTIFSVDWLTIVFSRLAGSRFPVSSKLSTIVSTIASMRGSEVVLWNMSDTYSIVRCIATCGGLTFSASIRDSSNSLVPGTYTASSFLQEEGPCLEIAGSTFHISVVRMVFILAAISRFYISGMLPAIAFWLTCNRFGITLRKDIVLLWLREVISIFGNFAWLFIMCVVF